MRLVAPVGPIGDLHRLTRPVTRAEDGSADSQALARGPRVTNTREETVKFIEQVRALENVEKLPALRREFYRFGSSGSFPVRGRGDLLHSFTVHSVPEYFFTESKQRVAEAAADALGAVFHRAKAEYDRARRNRMRQFLQEQQAEMLSPSILDHEHRGSAWLKQTLQRCADRIHADWASLFVWYDEPEKLVLYTSFNWYKSMEGVAFYRREQGWTGRIASGEQDVVVLPAQRVTDQTTNRYLESREPPEWRRKDGEPYAPHIGIRLHVGTKLIGVVVLGYYSANAGRLGDPDQVLMDFLQSMGQLLTFGVFWAQSETHANRADRLGRALSKVSELLLAQRPSLREWQDVVDQIRMGFSVERVDIYWVRDKRMESGMTSPHDLDRATGSPWEPYGLIRDLVIDNKEVEVRDASDPRLNSWPNDNGINALYAVPAVQPDRTVCAVLAFAYRTNTVDHPFTFLDAQERDAAKQIAATIGIAIGVRLEEQRRSELQSQLATATKIGAAGLYGGLLLHEMKTPLGIIKISSDVLRDFPPKDAAERVEYLVRIKASCDRAVQIINEAASRGARAAQLVSLQTLVREAVKVIEPEIPFTQINLTVHNKLTDNVRVDLYTMVGALVNLLYNALDAMRGAKGQLTVTTEHASQQQYLLIRIWNTGPPVLEEEVPGLFEPGMTTQRDGLHLGMGLPLAKTAIEAADGKIEMHSVAHSGVEVVVTLPLAERPASLVTKEAK
jgi:signal transduction histidine kinase